MRTNTQLESVRLKDIEEDYQNEVVIRISYIGEEDRRVLIARIEDNSEQSGIKFKSWERFEEWRYRIYGRMWDKVSVLEITLIKPERYDEMDIAKYIWLLIS